MQASGRTVRLRDGAQVGIRPIGPDDAHALAALYDRLSPESAYQRFFTAMRRLPPDWAKILAEVDQDRRAAIVATRADGELIGVARHDRGTGSDDAEIGLVVQDAWQGRGLGTILLTALFEHARDRSIMRFVAHVLGDNHRMLRLIDELGLVTSRAVDQGVVSLRFTPRASGGGG